MQHARLYAVIASALVLPFAVAACQAGNNTISDSVEIAPGSSGRDANTVSGDIRVDAGVHAGNVNTVSGGIDVGDGARIGEANGVSGGLKLGAHATSKTLNTVSGDITLGAGANVLGDVNDVSGDVSLAQGAGVTGTLVTVSGDIRIDTGRVGAGIRTVAGDIALSGASIIDGGIMVKKPNGTVVVNSHRVPRIVIGAGVTVNGPLEFELPVKLYISNDAHVAGPITGATPVKFSGPTPPAS